MYLYGFFTVSLVLFLSETGPATASVSQQSHLVVLWVKNMDRIDDKFQALNEKLRDLELQLPVNSTKNLTSSICSTSQQLLIELAANVSDLGVLVADEIRRSRRELVERLTQNVTEEQPDMEMLQQLNTQLLQNITELLAFQERQNEILTDRLTADIEGVNRTVHQGTERIFRYISNVHGRILVQQHFNGSTFFNRTWSEYKFGFGRTDGNYWIGNEQLHELTKDGQYRLRVDLQSAADGRWYWAEYSAFRVADEAHGYQLEVGGYEGTAGDSLSALNGMKFSTRDRDNDRSRRLNCAAGTCIGCGCGGGMWYHGCGGVFLNSPSDLCYHGFAWLGLPTGKGMSQRTLLTSRMTLLP